MKITKQEALDAFSRGLEGVELDLRYGWLFTGADNKDVPVTEVAPHHPAVVRVSLMGALIRGLVPATMTQVEFAAWRWELAADNVQILNVGRLLHATSVAEARAIIGEKWEERSDG